MTTPGAPGAASICGPGELGAPQFQDASQAANPHIGTEAPPGSDLLKLCADRYTCCCAKELPAASRTTIDSKTAILNWFVRKRPIFFSFALLQLVNRGAGGFNDQHRHHAARENVS